MVSNIIPIVYIRANSNYKMPQLMFDAFNAQYLVSVDCVSDWFKLLFLYIHAHIIIQTKHFIQPLHI